MGPSRREYSFDEKSFYRTLDYVNRIFGSFGNFIRATSYHPPDSPGKLVTVDGITCSGKSTLVNDIRRALEFSSSRRGFNFVCSKESKIYDTYEPFKTSDLEERINGLDTEAEFNLRALLNPVYEFYGIDNEKVRDIITRHVDKALSLMCVMKDRWPELDCIPPKLRGRELSPKIKAVMLEIMIWGDTNLRGAIDEIEVLDNVRRYHFMKAVRFGEPKNEKSNTGLFRNLRSYALNHRYADQQIGEESVALVLSSARNLFGTQAICELLSNNNIVVIDRYRWTTLAYQLSTTPSPFHFVNSNKSMQVLPDTSIVLTCDPGIAFDRSIERSMTSGRAAVASIESLYEKSRGFRDLLKLFREGFREYNLHHYDTSKKSEYIIARRAFREAFGSIDKVIGKDMLSSMD